jgi:hypothetical protein
MKYKDLSIIGAAALMLVLAAAPARSQNFNTNKRTNLTFSAPVRLPGMTLPVGTYVFVLIPAANMHIVQVLSQDGKMSLGAFLTIPNQRIEVTDKPYVLFKEAPEATAPPIQAWFYPGERIGDEFVYSETEALDISKATHQPVLTMPTPMRVGG